MSNQKQLTSEVYQDLFSSPTFSEPVKAGSVELDQLISVIAQDAEERRNNDSKARPYYAMELIRQSRLGALRLPEELGSGGASHCVHSKQLHGGRRN